MIGQTISHYKIVEKLGEGGMGVVYKAEDTQLGRPVALKFLAPHLVSNEEVRKRFLREARTAAALNHPNICTVYEIGEAGGRTFISMAYLEGRELAEEIADGPMEVERVLALAPHFADGLAEAHAKGIVHRDIKPANLFVTSNGRGVILDFGLAQLASANSKLTREGTTLGTCAYMSPEQTAGEEVDAQTDVWALGSVLYEMLAGQAPFRGHYEQAIVYSILNEDPEPLEAAPEVEAVIRRCLAKNPGERYDDGETLHRALRELQPSPLTSGTETPAAPSEVPRVAVLPLKTRAGDAELESFAEGLTEEITSGLSQFRHLVVVSAGAAAGFQGQADVREVSKGLGARFVLEGSIRKAGSSIRVSVQLLDAATGAHLWAERFDRDLSATDIFAVQDELTDRIVATVADPFGVLTRSLCALVKAKPIDTLTAHESVLRTFVYWQQVVPDEHAEVRAALERALQREPDHAEALACLSRVYLDEFRFDFNVLPDALDRALHTAQRAVELDATSQLAYRALAEAHYFRRELGAFRPAADRVLSLNPRDTSNVGMIGSLIAYAGDWPRGCAVVRKVMQINPHHAGWLNFVFVDDHYRKGEYEQALEAAEKVNMPGHFVLSANLAMINAQLGRTEAARKHLKTFIDLAPDAARNMRAELWKWLFSEEVVEHQMDGLRKAGLDVDGGEEAPAPTAVHTRQPFVGRQAEQDKLAARLGDISHGQGALALIGGEPGVGKTRLSEELLADARERGMLTFAGHCYEEGTAPFTPFVEILEQMVREIPADVLREALGDAAPDVVRLVPEIHRVVDDIPPPAELTPEQQRRVLFNAVLDLFRRLGARQPVVLLLDDLHWADEATLGLLQHLAPHLAGIRLLVLGTYRDVELDVGKPFEKAMAALVRQKQAERLRLRRLPQEAVAELLTALGGSQPPGALVQVVFHETEGNPFFVGEVFQHLSEEGKLFDEAGDWQTDVNVDELDVPEGVRLVIGRRLERLSEATPKLLTAAAVVGRRLDLKLVEALSDLDSDGFLEAIEESETAKLIVSEREGRETSCVFTHELIRSTLLGALSLPRRQRLHARVAQTMERVYQSDLTRHVSALAYHLYEAGAVADEAKTIRFLILAGEQSLETGAFKEARRDFDLALSLLSADERENRASLLWQRGLAHRSLGLWEKAIDDWETALPIYEELADRQGISSICQELAHYHVWTAQPVRGVEAARRGLRVLPPEPSADRCRLLGYCGWALGMACDLESADAMMKQALAMAEELSDPRLQGEVFLLSSWRLYHCNRRREQMEATGRAVELLRPTRALDKTGRCAGKSAMVIRPGRSTG